MRPCSTQIQPHEHTVHIGEISNNLADRYRQVPDERRNREDLVPLGQLGILDQVDYFQLIFPVQMLSANSLEVRQGRH